MDATAQRHLEIQLSHAADHISKTLSGCKEYKNRPCKSKFKRQMAIEKRRLCAMDATAVARNTRTATWQGMNLASVA